MSPILRSRWGPALFGTGVLLVLLAAVEAAIRAGVVSRFVVPMPTEIVGAFGRVIVEEGILHRVLQTATEGLGAAALIIVVGIPLGFFLYRSALWRRATEGWIAAFAAAPLVLAYPLFLVIFGRSQLTIITMGFAAGVTPVILKTLEGLLGTRRVLVDVGRSLMLTPAQQFRMVLLPSAIPTIFVGIRLGLIFALINVVGLEFLINFGGLGQLINDLAERYDLPGTYAAIVFVVLVSVLFFAALQRIEQWLRPGS